MSSWAPNPRQRLDAQVEHINYEVIWLRRGHDVWRQLASPKRQIGALAESDIGNLGLEAALVHCRALLDFMLPRGSRRAADVFACEYVPGWSARRPSPIVPLASAAQELGASVSQLRTALDGWVAHLGSTRPQAAGKPDWDKAFSGCRKLIVDWYGRLDAGRQEDFRQAYEFACV